MMKGIAGRLRSLWGRPVAEYKTEDDENTAKDRFNCQAQCGDHKDVVVEMGTWRAEDHKDMLRRREAGLSDHTLISEESISSSAHPKAAMGISGNSLNGPTTTQVLAFVSALALMLITIRSIPPLSSVKGGENFVWRPSKVEHFKLDKDLMIAYRDKNAFSLFLGMCVVYIILQTFCIPGSGTTLNLLAGCIYSEYIPGGEYVIALPYCVGCSTVGAVMAYTLSSLTARELLMRKFPTRINWLRQKIGDMEPQSRLFFFMSLRLSPLVPAWFLNLAAPMTPLPIWMFAIATMVGCTPSSLLLVKTGATISHLQPGEDILKGNYWQLVMLLFLAVAVFSIPFIIKRRLAQSDPDLIASMDAPSSNTSNNTTALSIRKGSENVAARMV